MDAKASAKPITRAKELQINAQKWTKPLMDAGWTVMPTVIFERQKALGLDALDVNILLHLAGYWWTPDNKPHPSKRTIAAAIGVEVNAPDVKPLIPNALEAGLTALRQRGHYPINHLVVIKDELIAKHGDLAADVFDAFARAKRHYVERLKAGRIEKPTEVDEVHRRVMEITGEPLPYGIAPNRNVIDALLGHALTQGIITKPVTAEELFAPSTRALVE